MSSGFVSGGTSDQPIARDDEWLRAQQELEEERRRKAEIGKQDDGKSLFEVLERNKMAKQEAFEEKSRLKNQFRSLDDDEVDFLDSVLESTRAKEAAVKKDTAEQLEAFRRQREKAEKVLREPSEVVEEGQGEDWTAPRKRRREKQNTLFPKKHKASTSPTGKDTDKEGDGTKTDRKTSTSSQADSKPSGALPAPATSTEKKPEAKPAPKPLVSLGLGDYGSDSD
ncbi:unnamed protein product [Penicillium salamii]|uniref:FAM192A/Fyv6 N-terminal domain-containing protein n=1 Tax=Penicillium salamii TaxID=1612424 RepID=A0A9W4JS62_9EURO|nr:unnamed protein product [Penicillium salamii]CAG8098478.1 unnamed protein product [Penicillium salamii]CAG8124795.1 unnamed protein product [Penicillium salamii]CAG8131132.1 unnamed protein product [Penicillium salamii]CAG8154502.1 unnamed protein product [Penicillium salamii]